MRDLMRNLAGQSLWYAGANSLAKAAGLLLLPLYTNTRYLDVSDYGRWGVLEVTVQIGIIVLSLQLPMGLVRFGAQPETRLAAARSVWGLTIGIAGALVAIGFLVLRAPGGAIWGLMSLYVAFELPLGVALAALRAEGRAQWYAGILLFKLFGLIALSYVALALWRMGLMGVLAAYAASSAGACLAALAATWGRWPWGWPRPDPGWTGVLVRVCAPLIGGALGSLALNAADRYVLAAWRTEFEVGLYVLAAKFGGVVNMLGAQPIQLAWLPFVLRLRPEERPAIVALAYRGAAVGLGALALCTSLFAPWVLVLMDADPAYRAALPLVPWISLGFAAFGLSLIWSALLLEALRSGSFSLIVAGTAALNLALNALLVPIWGALGAAVATLLAYTGLLLWTHRAVRNSIGLPLGGMRLLGLGLWTGLLAALGTMRAPEGIGDLALRFGLLGVWLLGAWLLGWVRIGDARALIRGL
ncbi:MAG: polysaccharide biosynthesis C-terminal domain-containing protein [Bacteroidota bacterium]|nr:polysaccharide biosynthesis C-terminal domain-containing protein [Rhodothermia bacterium]MDW8285951.1 polysaccharide biosynthesis C-terminal domain-containing protein [Bacteroidota bacterium]